MPQDDPYKHFDALANLIEATNRLAQTATQGNTALATSSRQLEGLENALTISLKQIVNKAMEEAKEAALKDLHDTSQAAVEAKNAYRTAANTAVGKVMAYAILTQILAGGCVAGALWLVTPHPSEISAKRDELARIEQRLADMKAIGVDEAQFGTCEGRPCVRINLDEKRTFNKDGSYRVLHDR